MSPPRHGELVVFTKRPRWSAIDEGEVYRCCHLRDRRGYRLDLAETIASGYLRGATLDHKIIQTAIWRPATAAEREAAMP